VNAVALGENKRLHAGVPFVRPVTEVDAAFQQSLHRNSCHLFFSFAFFRRFFPPCSAPGELSAAARSGRSGSVCDMRLKRYTPRHGG
jgi:hypothetical protein